MADRDKKPLSYIDWLKTTDVSSINEGTLFEQYNSYVSSWYVDTTNETASEKQSVVDVYKDVLKEITLNYTTNDEKRFLSNINYDDPAELDIIVPYFAKKLKDITQYIVSKRQDVKTTVIQNAHKGSELGTSKLIKHKILTLLSDKDFTDGYMNTYIPAVSSAAKDINVYIDPLYDTFQHYFDLDPSVDNKIYDPIASDERLKQLNSNKHTTNPDVWLNLTKAIEDTFKEIPLLLATMCDNITTSSGINLQFNSTRNDINDLPESYFVDGNISEENLILDYEKNLSEKYAGTKMVYLSTGSTATDFVSGDLFTPPNPSANLLNRYNSSYAKTPSTTNLKGIEDIGGFFTPTKHGITNYNTLESYFKIDQTKLEPNKVYVLPDPNFYGAGRGNTKTDQPKIFEHYDDVKLIKASRSNLGIHGDIINDNQVQKHYPYQSREETLRLQVEGISKVHDNVDFWTGEVKDIWANEDVYKLTPGTPPPIGEREDDLLITDLIVETYKTDIFGNSYALYKDTHPVRKTANQILNSNLSSTVSQNTSTSYSTLTSTASASLFGEYDKPYFDYQLSNFNTIEETRTGTTDVSLHERKTNEQVRFYFRDAYSTNIQPVSSALSGMYVKYNEKTDILTEIRHNVKRFDVIKDLIIVETPNFIVIEKLNQSSDGSISSNFGSPKYFSLSGTNQSFEKFSNWWYNEFEHCIYIGYTALHPHLSGSNYKAIYPVIRKFDINTTNVSTVFSVDSLVSGLTGVTSVTEYVNLTANGLTNIQTEEEINITSIDPPMLSFNNKDKTLNFTFLGKSINNESYLHSFYYNTSDITSFKLNQTNFFRLTEDSLHYHVDNFRANLTTNEPSLSSFLEGPQQLGNVEENFLFSTTGRQGAVDLPGAEGLSAGYIAFGGLTGRSTPVVDKHVQTSTALLGSGLSSNATDFIADTTVAPYTFNSSYITSNVALSSQADITVVVDVAFYTVTTGNNGYTALSGTRAPLLSSYASDRQPGDGLSVFFFDSDFEFYPAGVGSSLGYTNYNGPLFDAIAAADNTTINGIRGGFIGVGFDVKGNFGNTTDGKTGSAITLHPQASAYPYMQTLTTTAITTNSPNTITVRASELSGYQVIDTTDNLSTYPVTSSTLYNNSPSISLHSYVSHASAATFHKLRVSLQNTCKRLTVEILNTSDNKFYPYYVKDLDGTNIPTLLRPGVSFATSSDFMTCEIKNVGIYGEQTDYAKKVSNLASLTGTAFTVTT